MPRSNREKIAIIGGGIAGMYCAYILGMKGHAVTLYEATDRLGGRIRTIRLKSSADKTVAMVEELIRKETNAGSQDAGGTSARATIDIVEKGHAPKGSLADLEFYAEFGPMRVELEKQILLRGLFRHLDIKEDVRNLRDRDEPALTEFPSYASPSAINDPKYQVRPTEEGKSPMDLLRLALLRIMLELDIKGGKDEGYRKAKRDLTARTQRAAATGTEVLPPFSEWVKGLTAGQLFAIQCFGEVGGTPLYLLGFWNLLSDYLSHDAILKIRDLGTFYHLLPENPNAAEWLTWWLNGLSISDNLQGVFGGMSSLVEELAKKLKNAKNPVAIECKRMAVQMSRDKKTQLVTVEFADESTAAGFNRVILALPKIPVKKLVSKSEDLFAADPSTQDMLSCATNFPMVKVFVVVKNRWWGSERMANRYATRVPTRELHYWPARLSERYGMIMFYTDRPATAFWANYVPPGPQYDVSYKNGRTHEGGKTDTLPSATEERLLDKIVQYLSENDVPDLKRDDIIWYGIRDWGREPYCGANHCWRPERQYWKVMGRLGEISTNANSGIHICGEAYSDYHGFIEGALRSSVYVLHRILDGDQKSNLTWLKTYGLLASEQGKAKVRDQNEIQEPSVKKEAEEDSAYFKAITQWADQLDGFRVPKDDSFLAR